MKNRLTQLILPTLAIIALTVVVPGHEAHAQVAALTEGLLGQLNSLLASLVNNILTLASFMVVVAAAILNVSMVLTLHIKDFVTATPAVYAVWRTMRDVASLFFIFFLLWGAMKTILDLKGPKYGETIKNIVVAGILINFSFFIVSLGIDASNIISAAIYSQMLPNEPQITVGGANGTDIRSLVSNTTGLGATKAASGGISAIFTNSLKIQSLYDAQGGAIGTVVKDPLKIVLVGVVGIIMMITTAASFIIAAIAFIARLVILIFLLAFSPFLILSFVFPSLKEEFNFWKTYSSQLIFMPVYLLLTYAALTVLNNSNLMGAATANLNVGDGVTNWALSYIVLAVNFAIVIIILNLPLMVGLKMGGMATDWMKKYSSGWDAGKVWGKVGGTASGFVGRRTLGTWATSLDKSFGNTHIGNSMLARDIRSATIGKVATSKFGGNYTVADVQKERKEKDKKAKEINKQHDFDTALSDVAAGRPPVIGKTLKDVMGAMNEKQKLGLGADKLKNIDIIKHLKGSDFEAIKKSDDFTDEEKKDIADLRMKALDDAINGTITGRRDAASVKFMVENMEGKDLMKDTSMLVKPQVVAHLKPSQLQAMAQEGLDSTIKRDIRDQIDSWLTPHKSQGFINKNRTEWS